MYSIVKLYGIETGHVAFFVNSKTGSNSSLETIHDSLQLNNTANLTCFVIIILSQYLFKQMITKQKRQQWVSDMTQLGLHDTSFGPLLNETLSKSCLYQATLSLTFRLTTNIDEEGQINQWCSTTLQFSLSFSFSIFHFILQHLIFFFGFFLNFFGVF